MTFRPFQRSEPQFFVSVEAESGEHRVAVADGETPGSPLYDRGAARVLSFEFTDSDDKADKLSLTVDNWDLRNFDDPVWKEGNVIIASWGYPARMRPDQRMVIQKVTGAQQLTIEAKAEAVLMNRIVRTGRWEHARRSDVVRELALRAGFRDEQLDIEDTSAVLPSIQQARQTDAQLVRRLADAEGFVWYVDFDGFHFHQRRLDERPLRVYRWYTDPFMGEIMSFNITNDLTARPRRNVQRGRNPVAGEDITGDSTGTEQPNERTEPALAPVAEQLLTGLDELVLLIDPESGQERELPQSREAHQEATAQSDTAPTSTSSPQVAQREAAGRARRHRHTAVQATFQAVGDPMQFAKTVIQLEGLGRRLSIRYYVKEVKHTLGSSGYTMELTVLSDGTGGHSTRSELASGLELFSTPERNPGRPNNQEAPGSEAGAEGTGGPGGQGGAGAADAEPAALETITRVDPETGRETTTFERPTGRAPRAEQH
jgi:phage protein D